MELMYPIAIVVCLILSVLICFIKCKKTKYKQGKKIANTQYIKETEYYKSKVKRYSILSNLIKTLSIICIVLTSILIARPITILSNNQEKFNRDIILGLDISTSESEVNLELVKQFKKIIPNIKGDRIGIVLFNTTPVVCCPLTDDYDYINDCLDNIEKQLNTVIKNNGTIPHTFESDEEKVKFYTFWAGGVSVNSDVRGSSLVGDGLARNIIFISKFKK